MTWVSLFELFLVPTSPPLNVKGFLNNTSEKIVVTWEPLPLEHRNGIILGYSITYVAQNGGTQQSMIVNASSLSAELQNLRQFMLYAINVAAFNTAGKGPPSQPVVVRSPEGGKTHLLNVK